MRWLQILDTFVDLDLIFEINQPIFRNANGYVGIAPTNSIISNMWRALLAYLPNICAKPVSSFPSPAQFADDLVPIFNDLTKLYRSKIGKIKRTFLLKSFVVTKIFDLGSNVDSKPPFPGGDF